MTAPQAAPVAGEHVGSRKAAELLGVSERTVIRWADDGTLAVSYCTRGGHRRFRLEDVERFAADAQDADQ